MTGRERCGLAPAHRPTSCGTWRRLRYPADDQTACAPCDAGTMLQVITGMYFRDVELHATHHRQTLYTNVGGPWRRDRIDLGIGHLVPTTDYTAQVATMLACLTERLEAVREDGTDEFMISTGGTAIIEDLATVLSFALDATVTTNYGTAARLISPPTGSYRSPAPSDILPHVFTPPPLRLARHTLLSTDRQFPGAGGTVNAESRIHSICSGVPNQPMGSPSDGQLLDTADETILSPLHRFGGHRQA
ncbi:hypothetical protein ACQP06_18900 [Nocardia sp. CA-136227]|uniref:hypothetical protein n=1 Tax=Nocardia sp. CA-136227 TaxID=3239979 RepID=UPI003D974491